MAHPSILLIEAIYKCHWLGRSLIFILSTLFVIVSVAIPCSYQAPLVLIWVSSFAMIAGYPVQQSRVLGVDWQRKCPSSQNHCMHSHFFPFFFFFPPAPVAAPAFGSVLVPPIFTSPLSSTLGAEPPSAAALRSSASCGSAAISRPSLPRLPINLPTSAALLV